MRISILRYAYECVSLVLLLTNRIHWPLIMNYQQLLLRTGELDSNVLNVYPYGSRVYETATDTSDWDFIMIVAQKTQDQYSDDCVHVQFFTSGEFQEQVIKHEISALECLYLPTHHSWKQTHLFSVELNLVTLRHSLSAKSSNSWVKCKKKLTVEKDYDLQTGRKSMFHAFRIILFGIQLCEFGRITNYAVANNIYAEIMQMAEWENLFQTFKPRYNRMLSAFRLMAPKE